MNLAGNLQYAANGWSLQGIIVGIVTVAVIIFVFRKLRGK